MKKILLITDMHIADKPINGIDTKSAFNNVLKHASTDTQADVIILCGDLAQDGLETDYEFMCEQLNQYFPDTPVYAIAGNHDNQGNLKRVLNGQQSITYLDNGSIETESHQFIFLNSNITNYTEGYISENTLTWLQSLLKVTIKPVYIFTHHHTIPINLKIDDYIIKNRADFLNTLTPYASKIDAVICGHTHSHTSNIENGIKFITLPSASMQYNSTIKFEPENKQMYSMLDVSSGKCQMIEAN
ncbi:metallophosphoesterase [Francisellaceae bacterium]|nr:metallophosphoesterase [Francisellaceae bacterium]